MSRRSTGCPPPALMRRHLTFETILESSVRYSRGVAARLNTLLTSAQACQSLLSDRWPSMGGRISNGMSWGLNGALNVDVRLSRVMALAAGRTKDKGQTLSGTGAFIAQGPWENISDDTTGWGIWKNVDRAHRASQYLEAPADR